MQSRKKINTNYMNFEFKDLNIKKIPDFFGQFLGFFVFSVIAIVLLYILDKQVSQLITVSSVLFLMILAMYVDHIIKIYRVKTIYDFIFNYTMNKLSLSDDDIASLEKHYLEHLYNMKLTDSKIKEEVKNKE